MRETERVNERWREREGDMRLVYIIVMKIKTYVLYIIIYFSN